jgi:hypothetical protein
MQDQGPEMAEDERMMSDVIEAAKHLRFMVEQVTPEEFRWQEANYDRDSLLGRELLYLAANNEWVRATEETIDIARSDAIETKIQVDIDLDRITHEAFHQRGGQLWLPVVVLPPLVRPGLPEPDPFITLTVTDAAGNLLATLPNADVRHRISAAMAEIIVNMAIAWWPPDQGRPPAATRDQRLVLSAAIYRLLLRERAALPAEDTQDEMIMPSEDANEVTAPSEDTDKTVGDDALPRMSHARRELLRLVKVYSALLRGTVLDGTAGDITAARPLAEKPGSVNRPDAGMPFVQRLTQRAVLILNALIVSTIVVVAADRGDTPTVLTLQVPSRALNARPTAQSVLHPSTWRWLRPGTWNWVLPRAHLKVDLLLPSADADRQVEVNLPAGVSFDPSRPTARQAEMVVTVKQPPLLEHLRQLMLQLLDAPKDWPVPLYQCLADLAGVKAEAARELLRDHRVRPATGIMYPAVDELRAATEDIRSRLDKLRAELGRLSADGDYAEARTRLKDLWKNGDWLKSARLQRRTSADTLSARAVVARAGMIEDVSKRASPHKAKIHVHVAVTDAESFSIARFSGWMSALLMTVVLAVFLLSERFFKFSEKDISAEVLAIVLTLFSAIQAGRIERSDRSTVRGRLAVAGNKLIVASILPAVVLAVALAFSRGATWAALWAVGCIGVQLVVQGLLWLRLRRAYRPDSQRAARSSSRTGLVFTTDPPVYSHSVALHSSWWRSTTADALMLGRQAYGYVIWQRGTSLTLRELLEAARPAHTSPTANSPQHDKWLRRLASLATTWSPIQPADDLPHTQSAQPASRGNSADPGDVGSHATPDLLERPANVLALQRAGTAGQALTFAVFREQPKANWATLPDVSAKADRVTIPVCAPVNLDPDHLAPAESIMGTVEIFLGLPKDQEPLTVNSHPITTMLATAAEHRLSVLEVQLPVPTPTSAYPNRYWARVEVAFREFEIEQISTFLESVRECTYSAHKRNPKTGVPHPLWITGIKTISEGEPRIINPPATVRRSITGLVLASDMDVTACGRSLSDKNEDARTWLVLAICADSRNGIENYILQNLGNELRLAGLTYVLLHGKAVMLLVGHHPGGRTGWDNLQSTLRNDPKGASIEVCVEGWQSRKELGHAGPEPLLRVHIRSPDRPGATLDALDSLREILQATTASPDSIQENDWNVWYARIEVAEGNAGLILLTLRLAVDPRVVESWKLEDIERKVRQRAASKAAHAVGALYDDPSPQEDTVISVKRITWPTVRLRYDIRGLREHDRRPPALVLRPDRPAWLPAMELHGRDDNRPAGRGDPLLLRVRAGPVKRQLVIRIPPEKPVLVNSCRLFVADRADAETLHIVHPGLRFRNQYRSLP